MVQGLVVLALVVAGFVLHPFLHYAPSIVALLGAGLLVAVSVETSEVLSDVEWPTLAFFAGLFIMIGGLIETGVIGEISKALADVIGGSELGGSMVLLGASAVLSGIVDNIPYVATMAPITADLVHDMGGAGDHVMWWASRSAPTSAATPPPSALAPTSSSSASPNAAASPSASGSSPSTV